MLRVLEIGFVALIGGTLSANIIFFSFDRYYGNGYSSVDIVVAAIPGAAIGAGVAWWAFKPRR